MLENIKYQLVTKDELRYIVIQDYVDECYYNTYYIRIVNDDLFEIHDQPFEDCYRLEILPGFHEESWYEYCYQNVYEDEDIIQRTEEQLEQLLNDLLQDGNAYADYLSYREGLDIDHETKTIVF